MTEDWNDDAELDSADEPTGASLSLFEGDEGQLSYEQRKTLSAMLKLRYISAAHQPSEWRTLLESQLLIKSRLNDLFLDLHVDRDHEVAFKRQAKPEGGGKFRTLLYDTTYTREETILLMFLRERFYRERGAGQDAVFVDREDLLTRVSHYAPAHATDLSGNARKADNAIDSLLKSKILTRTPDEDRYRVEPVIEVLMTMAVLRQLLEWLQASNGRAAEPDTDTDDDLAGADPAGSTDDGPPEGTEGFYASMGLTA